MIKIIFVLFCLTSFNSFANDPLKACSNYTFHSGREECFDLIANNYFQEEVAVKCSQLTFDTDKTECLQSIKSKFYTPSNIEICFRGSFSSDKIECLARSGRELDHAEEKLKKILIIVKDAKIGVYEGDLSLVLKSLNKIIDLIKL